MDKESELSLVLGRLVHLNDLVSEVDLSEIQAFKTHNQRYIDVLKGYADVHRSSLHQISTVDKAELVITLTPRLESLDQQIEETIPLWTDQPVVDLLLRELKAHIKRSSVQFKKMVWASE